MTTTPRRTRSDSARQVADVLRRQVLAEETLPCEEDLTAQFSATRNTVREALSLLRDDGLITRQPGVGTVVTGHKYPHGLNRLAGLAEVLHEHGTVTNEVRAAGPVSAPAVVAQRLELDERSEVVYIERLRRLNGVPLSLDLTYLPLPDRRGHHQHALPAAMKGIRGVHSLLAIALLAAGCSASADEASTVDVVIGYRSKTINTVTAGTLLRSLGYLEKRLDVLGRQDGKRYRVTWQDYSTGAPITAQLVAGKIDIGSMGDYPLLINGSRNQEFGDGHTKLISATGYNLLGALNMIVVRPDSRRIR